MLKIQVIIGSTRPNRFSEKPAHWILEELKKQKGIETELVDLRDYPMPFYDSAKTPSMYGTDYPSPEVQKWADKINEADGYIIVTPEYNHGYPAVLKNALDYISLPLHRKPIGFVSYGSAGGSRAVEQLRQVVAELQMTSVRDSVLINWDTYMAVSKAEQFSPELFAPVQTKADSMIENLIWWGEALKTAREKE